MANLYGPRIVTDGLVLHLDAGNRKSYPGSGNTCYDLSGGSNNGTLNSVDYSVVNNGTFSYNATSDVITASMTNLRPTTGITQECWFNITSNTAQVFIGAQYGSASNNSYALWINVPNSFAAGVNIGGSLNYQTQNYSILINNWYHFIHTYNGSTQTMFLNGNTIKSWSTSGSIAYDSNNTLLAIGNDWNSGYNGGATVAVKGNLAIAKIYNHALSANEVQQNYNALKGRFGL